MFAHGRRLGLRAPMHFFHYLLLFGFAAIIFDWTHFIPEDPEESWIPYFFQVINVLDQVHFTVPKLLFVRFIENDKIDSYIRTGG